MKILSSQLKIYDTKKKKKENPQGHRNGFTVDAILC